jgi:hypothetical protein
MIFNILLLLGIGIGIYFISRAVLDIRKQITDKLKYVERVIHHPEEVIAEIGTSLIRAGLQKAKTRFFPKNTTHSSE